jgi:hypothetical protein
MDKKLIIAKSGAMAILAIMLLVSFVGTATDPPEIGNYDCDTSGTFDLIAGQDTDTGDVMVWHDTENLYIKYTTDGNWLLEETHVFVGDESDVPTTKSGNLKIGKFPYSMDHDPMVNMYTYEFDFEDDLGWEAGDQLFIIAHAVVTEVVAGVVVQSETAFGCEYDYDSPRWACYIDYDPCKVLEMPDSTVTVNVAVASDSYFDTTVTGGDNDVPSATYEGWCHDLFHGIVPGTDYTATLYSSYDPFLPAGLQDDDWDLVNYIINMKGYYMDTLGYSAGDIQNAIWYFFEDLAYGSLDANEKAIVADAEANGEGFYPASGEYMAIIVYISDTVQGTFIEVDP